MYTVDQIYKIVAYRRSTTRGVCVAAKGVLPDPGPTGPDRTYRLHSHPYLGLASFTETAFSRSGRSCAHLVVASG